MTLREKEVIWRQKMSYSLRVDNSQRYAGDDVTD